MSVGPRRIRSKRVCGYSMGFQARADPSLSTCKATWTWYSCWCRAECEPLVVVSVNEKMVTTNFSINMEQMRSKKLMQYLQTPKIASRTWARSGRLRCIMRLFQIHPCLYSFSFFSRPGLSSITRRETERYRCSRSHSHRKRSCLISR